MKSYEIEVKTLLGESARADEFREQLLSRGAQPGEQEKQLNHYFVGGDYQELKKKLQDFLSEEDKQKLDYILGLEANYSLRSRETHGRVKIVIKSSVDVTTSENGIQRLEFEGLVPLSLDELDQLILSAEFEYQAKWSREREQYSLNGIEITLDKNAGYGYVSEFEKVVEDETQLLEAEADIRNLMQEFSLQELDQERLARMFEFYNKNWSNYYGTDKVFTIL